MAKSGLGSTGPNVADIVTGNYTASGIVFAKYTDANLEVAKSINSGPDDLTDVFAPVTLATGKITQASTSSPVIQGTATEFLTDFADGDYLFYFDASATPYLIGKISTRNSDTQITLTGNSSITISTTPSAGQLYPCYCGKTNTIVGLNENIIMRVPVVPYGTDKVWMPNWNKYRLFPTLSSYNDPAAVSIVTSSSIDNPTQPTLSPININFAITSVTSWIYLSTGGSASGTGFRYTFVNATLANGGFPTFAYAILNPYGDSAVESLPPNTLYKLFANESFANNGLLVSANYPELFLKTSGY